MEKLFLDAGDFDRLQDAGELYLRTSIDGENYDLCSMACSEVDNTKEYCQEIVKRFNIHEELIEYVSKIIGCMALERVERFDLVEIGKALIKKAQTK